jgi:TPP-dependent pyruvate/acetoin dehydrogenase alpha subunit
MTTAVDKSRPFSNIDNEQLMRMFRRMVMIRQFEENANDLYTRALMPGITHLYSGEEAIAVGVCEALRSDDYITSTHPQNARATAAWRSASSVMAPSARGFFMKS